MVTPVALTGAHAPGATPLEPDDIEGLLPESIATQGELNAFEAENILSARDWLGRRRRKPDPLDLSFTLELHKRMFGKVWNWAGQYRPRETNIGIEPRHIPEQLKQLLENTREQIKLSPHDIDAIAVRFHHDLVRIHPFRNGNGRHARELTDILLEQHGRPRFTWGSAQIGTAGAPRQNYLTALQAADDGDYGPLNAFVRT